MKNEFFLTSQWKFFVLFLMMNGFGTIMFAQVVISGKISDASGNVMPGTTIQVSKSAAGTSSDANGNYSLTIVLKPGVYDLLFSRVGFKSTKSTLNVSTEKNYSVNVTLTEDPLGLDEIIVTGTTQGTTKKELGSSISTVKADQLSKGASGNVLQALQGKTPGAQIIQNSGDPAGGVSVRLRGVSTVNSSSEPLYIVDGIIVNNATNRVTNTSGNYDGNTFIGSVGQNRLSDINPADIERIEVLNGAAAAAIYGSRANAGVVQIFTKRGKSGAPQISFSSNVLVSELRKQVEVNQSPTKFGPLALTQDIIQTARKTISPGVFADTLSTIITPVSRYNYQDYIFNTAIGTDNNVSISGGSDKTKYFASGSYYFNQGIIKNTDYRRFSFRSNVDQVLSDWASVSVGLNYINSNANEKPDGNSFFSPMNSVTIIGNIHDIYTRSANGNVQVVGERGRANPVSVIEDIKQQQITSRILANTSLKLKPFKNFTVDYTLGIDNYSQNGTTFIPPYAYNVSPAFFGGGFPINDSLNGYASAATNSFFQINHEVNATYQLDISDRVNSTTQVGYSTQYEKNNYILAQGRGLAPVVQTVNGASTILPPNDERSEISISGMYVQQNFKYRNHLFITGAVRIDGSSVFGEDERNQVYLKANGSYILSGADYWEGLGVSGWWDLFKVRAAYGESGNLTGIGAYSRFNTYSSNAFLGKTSLTSSATLANENVKPERQRELEFGTDLAFFKSRLSIQFNYYIKKVDDLLISRVIAPTTGFSNLLDNFGSLENRGFEVVVNGGIVRSKNLNWNITGIYSQNRNKAVKIGQALTLLSTNPGAPVAIIEGQPIGVFYGTFFATDPSGNQIKTSSGIPQGERGVQNNVLSFTPSRDANGQPTTGATLRKVIGNPNPDYTASLVNEVSYKRINLRIQLDAVQGVDVFNADWRTRQGVGNGKVAEQEHRGLLPRGYIAGVYAVEEWRIDDGSFVKLREASLSYSFGKFKSFNDISLSVSGRNLISWDNYKGYDPEVNSGGQSNLLRGIDFGSVPIPRTFSFGLQAKF